MNVSSLTPSEPASCEDKFGNQLVLDFLFAMSIAGLGVWLSRLSQTYLIGIAKDLWVQKKRSNTWRYGAVASFTQ